MVKLPFSSKSSSTAFISFSRKNIQRACRKAGAVWAITPSKSKRIAWKGFILFHYCSSDTPLCSWFVEGKASCDIPERSAGEYSDTNQDTSEKGSPYTSSSDDIAASYWFWNIGNHVSYEPSEDITCEDREKRRKVLHGYECRCIFIFYYLGPICNPRKSSTLEVYFSHFLFYAYFSQKNPSFLLLYNFFYSTEFFFRAGEYSDCWWCFDTLFYWAFPTES